MNSLRAREKEREAIIVIVDKKITIYCSLDIFYGILNDALRVMLWIVWEIKHKRTISFTSTTGQLFSTRSHNFAKLYKHLY